eukprot:326276_1
MGGFFAKDLELIQGKHERRILIVVLDAAGKTTILYKLKIGDIVHTIPTIGAQPKSICKISNTSQHNVTGFNVETVEYKNINFTVWDVGGQESIRPLMRHYY